MIICHFLLPDHAVPQDPPTDVRADAVGSKAIRVTWKGPTGNNNMASSSSSASRQKTTANSNHIKGYYIGFKAIHTQDVFTYKTVEVTGNSNQLQPPYETVIGGLERLTKYVIVVKAFNRKGSGPASDEIYVKTNDLGN